MNQQQIFNNFKQNLSKDLKLGYNTKKQAFQNPLIFNQKEGQELIDYYQLKKEIRSHWYDDIKKYKDIVYIQNFVLKRMSGLLKKQDYQDIDQVILKGSCAVSYNYDLINKQNQFNKTVYNNKRQLSQYIGKFTKQGDLDFSIKFKNNNITLHRALEIVKKYAIEIIDNKTIHQLAKKHMPQQYRVNEQTIFDHYDQKKVFSGIQKNFKPRCVYGDLDENGSSFFYGNQFKQQLKDTFQLAVYTNIKPPGREKFHLVRVFFMNNRRWNAEFLDFGFQLNNGQQQQQEQQKNDFNIIFNGNKLVLQNENDMISDGLNQIYGQPMSAKKIYKVIFKIFTCLKQKSNEKYQKAIKQFKDNVNIDIFINSICDLQDSEEYGSVLKQNLQIIKKNQQEFTQIHKAILQLKYIETIDQTQIIDLNKLKDLHIYNSKQNQNKGSSNFQLIKFLLDVLIFISIIKFISNIFNAFNN